MCVTQIPQEDMIQTTCCLFLARSFNQLNFQFKRFNFKSDSDLQLISIIHSEINIDLLNVLVFFNLHFDCDCKIKTSYAV